MLGEEVINDNLDGSWVALWLSAFNRCSDHAYYLRLSTEEQTSEALEPQIPLTSVSVSDKMAEEAAAQSFREDA